MTTLKFEELPSDPGRLALVERHDGSIIRHMIITVDEATALCMDGLKLCAEIQERRAK